MRGLNAASLLRTPKMAASSLGQYALSFTFTKAYKNQKQLRVVVVPSSVSFPVPDSGALLVAHTLNPLPDRAQLTSVFVSFIDIWNLHRPFLFSLPPCSFAHSGKRRTLSAPLSLCMDLIATKHDFAAFITRQEADPHCRNPKLRDWLLSIIQRYLRHPLLLKDLISYAPIDEHAPLVTVHTLVSKGTFPLLPWIVTSDPLLVALSLNTSLQTHAQTLSLLAIQRNAPNFLFQFTSTVVVCSSAVRSYRSKLRHLKRGSSPYFRIVSFCYEPKLDFNLFRFHETSPPNIASTATPTRGRRQEFPHTEGWSTSCQPSGCPMVIRMLACVVGGHFCGGVDVTTASHVGDVCGSFSGKVQSSTSSQPDEFVDPVGFPFRLSISPKVRRTGAITGSLGHVMRPCFLSWTELPPIPGLSIGADGGTTNSL